METSGKKEELEKKEVCMHSLNIVALPIGRLQVEMKSRWQLLLLRPRGSSGCAGRSGYFQHSWYYQGPSGIMTMVVPDRYRV